MKTFKRTSTIKENNQLILDDPIPVNHEKKVNLIILISDKNDFKEKEWLAAAKVNPVFDFLKESEEDIYSITDSKPFIV